jgi:hypothetical protein
MNTPERAPIDHLDENQAELPPCEPSRACWPQDKPRWWHHTAKDRGEAATVLVADEDPDAQRTSGVSLGATAIGS